MIILSVNVLLQVRKKTKKNAKQLTRLQPPSPQRELTGIPVLSARGLVLCFPPRAHEFGNEFVAFRLRLRLHEHSFISIRFHDFETVSVWKCLHGTVFARKSKSSWYRRFHGRGRHLVGRAKNSDGLGRVIVSAQNGSCMSFHGQRNIRIS